MSNIAPKPGVLLLITLFFLVRTSFFGAEAEPEPNVLIFLAI